MSKMSDVYMAIRLALEDGLSVASICYRLGVPGEWVQAVIDGEDPETLDN